MICLIRGTIKHKLLAVPFCMTAETVSINMYMRMQLSNTGTKREKKEETGENSLSTFHSLFTLGSFSLAA